MRFRPYKAWEEGTEVGQVEVDGREALIEHLNSYGLLKVTGENLRVYQFGAHPDPVTGWNLHICTVKFQPVGFTDGPC